ISLHSTFCTRAGLRADGNVPLPRGRLEPSTSCMSIAKGEEAVECGRADLPIQVWVGSAWPESAYAATTACHGNRLRWQAVQHREGQPLVTPVPESLLPRSI